VESGGYRQQHRNAGQDGVSFVQQGGGKRRKGPCFHCGEFGHLAAQCDKLSASQKQKLEQATRGGQAHVNVGDEDTIRRANGELQECLQGVANVHVAVDDLSIGTLDDDQGWVDGVAFQSVGTMPGDGVTLHSARATNNSRFDCGQNKLVCSGVFIWASHNKSISEAELQRRKQGHQPVWILCWFEILYRRGWHCKPPVSAGTRKCWLEGTHGDGQAGAGAKPGWDTLFIQKGHRSHWRDAHYHRETSEFS
jgi:hypothetical protein